MSQMRLKWMRLKIRVAPEVIFNFIKNTPYSDVVGAGFTRVDLANNEVSATFNKKLVVLEPVLDPFDNVIEFERVSFDQVVFSIKIISHKICLLTFYNPPKSVKSFIDYFSQSVDVAYGSMSLDVKDFLMIIRKEFGFKVFGISKVKVSNLPVTERTKATLELSSSGDALSDLKFFVGDGELKLDKLKALGVIEYSKFSFELSSVASAVVPEEHYKIFNDVVALIEKNEI